MNAEWWFLLPVVFMVAVVWWFSRFERQRQARREETLRADSQARGWRFEVADEGAFRLVRWQGQTDGVTWTAEYRRGERSEGSSGSGRTHRVHWWADGFQGPTSPVMGMGVPMGKEASALEIAQGDGLLSRMAQKAAGLALDAALDVRFGQDAGGQVNARELRMVKDVAVKGYIVMAVDAGVAARWISSRMASTLADQMTVPGGALADDTARPWWLWLGRRLYLSMFRPVNSVQDMERLVRAGVALVNAAG